MRMRYRDATGSSFSSSVIRAIMACDIGDRPWKSASGVFDDTVGESFELNFSAAQETETLTRTAKPIILTQGSMRGKWKLGYLGERQFTGLFRFNLPQMIRQQYHS